MYVALQGASAPVLAPEACVERSRVLQQAQEAGFGTAVPLPCHRAAWDDWVSETSSRAQPLEVAQVRNARAYLLEMDLASRPRAMLLNLAHASRAKLSSGSVCMYKPCYTLTRWHRLVGHTEPHSLRLLQLAHFLGAETQLWAEAFWAANRGVTTAFIKQVDKSPYAASTTPAASPWQEPRRARSWLAGCGTGRQQSGARTGPRAADAAERAANTAGQQSASPAAAEQRAAAAEAAWAALMAKAPELAEAVLSMHPAVTAAYKSEQQSILGPDTHGPLVTTLSRLPPPLRVPGVRRLFRTPGFHGHLHVEVASGEYQSVAHVLRNVPDATSVSLVLGAGDQSLGPCPRARAVLSDTVRSVGPLLLALQALPRLRRLVLEGGWSPQALTPLGGEVPDLLPLARLQHLTELCIASEWLSEQPGAAVITRLTGLHALKLRGFAWPLGLGDDDQRGAAAVVGGGGGVACSFPHLQSVEVLPADPSRALRLPAAPRLVTLKVWQTAPIDRPHMRSIYACVAASHTSLTSLTLSETDPMACSDLSDVLVQAQGLRALCLHGVAVWDTIEFAHTMHAVATGTTLRSLALSAQEQRVGEEVADAITVCIGVLAHLETVCVAATWDACYLPKLVRAATRLTRLSDLVLEGRGRGAGCSASLHPHVRVRVVGPDDRSPRIFEDDRDCTQLVELLVAWAAMRRPGAEALDVAATVFLVTAASPMFAERLAAMQALRRVSFSLDVATQDEVVQLASMCHKLPGLTSLACSAGQHVSATGAEQERFAQLQLAGLTGLQELSLGAVRCGAQFEEDLLQALAGMQQLRSLSLENVRRRSQAGSSVCLATVYEHLPATLTRLRLAQVPLDSPGPGAVLAGRLLALTQLKELLLCTGGLNAAALRSIVAAVRPLPALDEVLVAGPAVLQRGARALAVVLEPAVPQAALRFAGSTDAIKGKLERLLNRELSSLDELDKDWDVLTMSMGPGVQGPGMPDVAATIEVWRNSVY